MTRNNPHSTSVDTSVEMYLTHHRRNLRDELEAVTLDLLLIDRVSWGNIIRQLTQLVADVGAVNAAALLNELGEVIKAGALLDCDWHRDQITPFDELVS